MAHITAFKGVVYNPEKIKDFGEVCTPPYDVISKDEQNEFYEKHPNNIIRLILGKPKPGDTEKVNAHSRAAEFFKQWQSDKVLIQDAKPAIYFTSVDFMDNKGNDLTRYGMIVRVGLEPFEKGIILPHEKTFSKVKTERLNLMKVCHANFSPIFSLFSDPGNQVVRRLKSHSDRPADMAFVDTKGLSQKMWRVTDETITHEITRMMADKILYIADGHHRYETALNYRKWASETLPGFSENHSANYVMMYLSSMDEPGLTIFPAHRLVSGLPDSKLNGFMVKAGAFFDTDTFPFTAENREQVSSDFMLGLESGQSGNAIGVCLKNISEFYLLKVKPGVMEKLFSHEIPPALRELDVTILTHLIFMEILGFDQAMLDSEEMMSYQSNIRPAVNSVLNSECKAAFILNPTRIEQVRRVAREGLIMPRKSTYFYPKVITGQAIHKLE
ncbi:MAG: DUF1015 domain-containing protein [Proteobacteria bacterium]|nr:DUF1015 domain-containing protein [Pseudomonadota bacterium]MBU4470244.1 DUF1015 domain-containing protein [Pseudomonadota bacterium]MCG2752659.1 DUF1015 domain-containing protein [Desulfobacteraceae bacterium]